MTPKRLEDPLPTEQILGPYAARIRIVTPLRSRCASTTGDAQDQFQVWITAKSAEAIEAVPGVDCLMVGNGDLRLDLGLYVSDGPEPEFNKCLEQIVNAAKKCDEPVLNLAGPSGIEKRSKQGCSVFVVGYNSSTDESRVHMHLHFDVREKKRAIYTGMYQVHGIFSRCGRAQLSIRGCAKYTVMSDEMNTRGYCVAADL